MESFNLERRLNHRSGDLGLQTRHHLFDGSPWEHFNPKLSDSLSSLLSSIFVDLLTDADFCLDFYLDCSFRLLSCFSEKRSWLHRCSSLFTKLFETFLAEKTFSCCGTFQTFLDLRNFLNLKSLQNFWNFQTSEELETFPNFSTKKIWRTFRSQIVKKKTLEL